MAMTTDAAMQIALNALVHLSHDPSDIGDFLQASGLDAQDLRLIASDPGVALHFLDFVLEDDTRVLQTAAGLNVAPREILTARTALSGPGSFGWEVD